MNIETVQSECVIETDYDVAPAGRPRRKASINKTPTSRFSDIGPGAIFSGKKSSTPVKRGGTAGKLTRNNLIRHSYDVMGYNMTPVNKTSILTQSSHAMTQPRNETSKLMLRKKDG